VTTIPSGLPAPPADAARATCVGGASFDTAPALVDGRCTDTLSTGETRYYSVHLDWGQRLAYRIVVERVVGAGHGTAFVQSAVATPLRQEVTLASNSNAARDFGGPTPITLTGSTLVPADYGNRDSSRSDVRGYALAGDYYLSLGMSYPVTALPYRTPVTISVHVAGTPQPGPQYVTSSPERTPRPSPVPTSAVTASTAAAKPGGGTAWLAITAGTVVVLALGGVLAVRRRRTTARREVR
jgi:Ca-activated chloride channel homolog